MKFCEAEQKIDWDHKPSIDDDDDVLLVCNPEDAFEFIEEDDRIRASLVITEVVDPGILYVVRTEEFVNWLKC